MKAVASPPATGPVASPSANAEARTPSAAPTLERGVSDATRAVAAATVPDVRPWTNRSATSSQGLRTKASSPTQIAPPIMARISIGRRPWRSATTPQMGPAIAIANPLAALAKPVQSPS